jgi:DNA-binding CsgD family transcriptional regulator
LFIGAYEGFLHFNPTHYQYAVDSFRTYIRQIDVLGSSDSTICKVDFGELEVRELVLPYSLNSLRFSASSIFYTNQESIEYSYQIENFNATWSAWTTKSVREYLSLPPGDYRFKVKSRNIYKIESNVASIPFRILPPWYRTGVAYFNYVITVITFLGLWYYRLRSKYTKEKNIIRFESQQKINEKEFQIEEISKSSEEQIIKLRDEKLHAEIDHKNKELASSTMHILNKNQLLADIRDSLIDSEKNSDPQHLSSKIKSLVDNITKSISEDADWEQFEFHFDRVHGDFTRRIQKEHPSLSAQDMKIIAYLRMNLSSKEIAHLLNISMKGVEKARYRLRKRLGLKAEDNLTEYILRF